MADIELPFGRKADLDLGDGHALRWVGKSDRSGRRVGAIVYHHANTESGWCSSAIWWEEPYEGHGRVHWQIHSQPDEHLTLSPSLQCTQCGDHGFIRDGKWIRV